MSTMFLSDEEVVSLTGRVRYSAQARALKLLGIEGKIRPDGTVAVLRAHVEKEFGGVSLSPSAKRKTEPNWSVMA